MTVSNYTVRIDDTLRKDAAQLFEKMGLTLPAAINAFLRKSVQEQRMPFMLGEEENDVKSVQQLPEGIKWPRWDDGTLFDPREIGSRKVIDAEGNRIQAHRLCYDGGMWFILTDDEGYPVASTGGIMCNSFPRSLFEGWRTSNCVAKPGDEMGFHISRRTVKRVIAFLGEIEESRLSMLDLKAYLDTLSDDQMNALFAIYFLSAHLAPSLEDAIEEMRNSHYGARKVEDFAEKVGPGMRRRLESSLAKMTAADWETLAE